MRLLQYFFTEVNFIMLHFSLIQKYRFAIFFCYSKLNGQRATLKQESTSPSVVAVAYCCLDTGFKQAHKAKTEQTF
jgi:hypothetical protein